MAETWSMGESSGLKVWQGRDLLLLNSLSEPKLHPWESLLEQE